MLKTWLLVGSQRPNRQQMCRTDWIWLVVNNFLLEKENDMKLEVEQIEANMRELGGENESCFMVYKYEIFKNKEILNKVCENTKERVASPLF